MNILAGFCLMILFTLCFAHKKDNKYPMPGAVNEAAESTKTEGNALYGGTDETYVSLTVIVPVAQRHCYYYQAFGDFEIDYQVLQGGSLDIDVDVLDASNNEVEKRQHSSSGTIGVPVAAENIGKSYTICFNNIGRSNVQKKIALDIDIDDSAKRSQLKLLRTLELPFGAPQEFTLDRFYDSMEEVDINLRQITQHQAKFRNIELIDRSLMEDNFTRVNTWSIFQFVTMIVVGLFQVFLIKSLFDEKNPFHKYMQSKNSNYN